MPCSVDQDQIHQIVKIRRIDGIRLKFGLNMPSPCVPYSCQNNKGQCDNLKGHQVPKRMTWCQRLFSSFSRQHCCMIGCDWDCTGYLLSASEEAEEDRVPACYTESMVWIFVGEVLLHVRRII